MFFLIRGVGQADYGRIKIDGWEGEGVGVKGMRSV